MVVPVVPLHPRSGLVLPANPATPLKLVNFVALWPCSCQQGSPRMWFEANLKQIMRDLPDFPQARGGGTSFQ